MERILVVSAINIGSPSETAFALDHMSSSDITSTQELAKTLEELASHPAGELDTTHLDSNGKSPAVKIMTWLTHIVIKVRNCFLDMNCQKHY